MATKRTYTGGGAEDTQALQRAYDRGLRDYAGSLGSFRATDMVMALGGDKSALVHLLAGIPEGERLPAKGTKERTDYETQRRNVNRWLAAESGRDLKEKRRVSSQAQDKFRNAYVKQNPPAGRVTASITGWIGYSNDWRYRSIEIPSLRGGGREIDTEALNAAMQAGDVSAAMHEIFDAYAPGAGITVSDAEQFDLHFEGDY